jgi:hypothetical protein
VCLPDLPDGDPCNEDSDCMSGHCDNNLCCEAGDCCTEPDDCPSSYTTAPTCDTPTGCQGTRDTAQCLDYQCSTQFDVGDDSACTNAVVASDCGLYPSVRCSGAVDQPAPICTSFCTSDAECDEGAHCDLNACVPDLPDGEGCDEASDCVSNHCQNAHCCVFGDCCDVDGDCPSATYGEPSVCDSAATCQGHRVDPACDPLEHRCEAGADAADDSGCAGLTSNDCGNYPSVLCTAAVTQPTDQAGLCAASCTTDLQCDPGAHCSAGGACVADGEAGDPCGRPEDCGTGLSCVDGVCCRTSCTGRCMACDVAGHEGTCWNVPDGTDPDGECAGFNCDGYYYGWSGDSCSDRADAPDSAVGCNGAGACETASEICPAQGRGSTTITCDDNCQNPTVGTCTGTTAGTCTNVNPGTQTCGVGECQVTVPQCSGGADYTCVPDAPGTETCNDLDDDCNGTSDDNVAATDGYEPNNTCAAPRSLGTVAEGNSEQSWTATLYYTGDDDYYRFYAEEGTHTCIPFTGQTYTVRVRLVPPSSSGDCVDYDLYLYDDGCGTLRSSILGGCAEETITYSWSGTCSFDDSRYFRIGVLGWLDAWECVPYTLYVDMY